MLELTRSCSVFHRVHIGDDALERALVFARDIVGTMNYRESNQFELTKIKSDHFISKVGEEAVKQVFTKYCSVEGPDYTIYVRRKKSWDPDLRVEGIGLAVKTQATSAARRYGLSWTFQSSESRVDPILRDDSAWVIFVEYDDVGFTYDCTVSPPFQVGQLRFGEPVLKHLKGKKKVVYNSDLPTPGGRIVDVSEHTSIAVN